MGVRIEIGRVDALDGGTRARMRRRVLGRLAPPPPNSLIEDFAYGLVVGLTLPGEAVVWIVRRIRSSAARVARRRSSALLR